MLYLGFWAGMLKNYYHNCNQRPPICVIAKFRTKIGILKFGTKNLLFGCFGQHFWKTNVMFEISTLEFVLLQNFVEKWKCLNWDQNALFGYFWAIILTGYCHIWNQSLEFAYFQNFAEKQKCLNLGPNCLIWVFLTKIALFGYFWARIFK